MSPQEKIAAIGVSLIVGVSLILSALFPRQSTSSPVPTVSPSLTPEMATPSIEPSHPSELIDVQPSLSPLPVVSPSPYSVQSRHGEFEDD